VQVWQVVEIICDSSFLMILASRRIKNISNIETEIGTIEYVIPDIVVRELERISGIDNKKKIMLRML
jgi:rRNA-processing protein FCF1